MQDHGSTSWLAVYLIAQKAKQEGLTIQMIPTSYEIELLCKSLDLPMTTVQENIPTWGFDGADEVSPEKWLIKGRGGALLREKRNMEASPITYILVDNTKKVDILGKKYKVPVECRIEKLEEVEKGLVALGGTEIELRKAVAKDGPVITESGNVLLDVKFDKIEKDFEKRIKEIPGVAESGLFIDYPVEIISE